MIDSVLAGLIFWPPRLSSYHREHRSIFYECFWIKRSYIEVPDNFNGFKVLLSKASGAGAFGEKLASLAIASKQVGHTQSFVSMGNFNTEAEADAHLR